MNKANNTRTAFVFLVSLFFMWAFLTAMNDILIPFVKELFDFGYTEAALVQFLFFRSLCPDGITLGQGVGNGWAINVEL